MRSGSSSLQLSLLRLLQSLGEQLLVVGRIFAFLRGASLFERETVSLALQNERRDEALDLGRLAACLLAFLFGQSASDDVLSHVILLVHKIEEFADLHRALWSTLTGHRLVRKTGNLILTLLDNDEVENAEVAVDHAAAHRFATTLSRATGPVAWMSETQQQTNAAVCQNTLHHRKALLVVASRNTHDIALPLVAEAISADLCRHALLVETSQLLVIVDVDQLLTASGWV